MEFYVHQVYHHKYGKGIVTETRNKGFELKVTFEDNISRWVRYSELITLEPGVEYKEVKDENSDIELSKEQFKSRRIIEALRLGIVPLDCVEQLTYGREKEIAKIKEWLESDEHPVLLLVGGYGTGKTHLLQYTMVKALKEKYAVTWLEMDPNETPFHKPKRVYKQALKNFKYSLGVDQEIMGFRDFLSKALNKGAFKDHIYFKFLMGNMTEEVWNWIEAQEPCPKPICSQKESFNRLYYNHFPPLYDYSKASNIYCYLLSSLGWAAKEIFGLNGFVLIFDEAEVLTMNYYKYQTENGFNFLKALIKTARNESLLIENLSKSNLNDITKSIPFQVPFLYKQPSALKILLGSTSVEMLNIKDIMRIDLKPLSKEAFKELFQHVYAIYHEAYALPGRKLSIHNVISLLEKYKDNTRVTVKALVEALDMARLND